MDEETKNHYRRQIEESQLHDEKVAAEIKAQKRSFLIGMILIVLSLFLFLFMVDNASAAPVEQENGISKGIFNEDFNKLPNEEEAYYQIDYSNTTPEEQEQNAAESFVEGITNFNPIQNSITDIINEQMMAFVNLVFEFNKMMANLMIGILDFGFNANIINAIIDVFEGMVVNISGVSGTTISGGLFGPLLGIALLFSALYAGMQMIGSRGQLAALGTILKAIVALTISYGIISEFGPLMKGLNEAGTALSSSILTGGTNIVSGDSRTPDELRDEVSENLWNEFIGRPYLIMQYGTDDVEDVSEARVNELLAIPPGPDRITYVEETEIGERGNRIMTFSNVFQRVAFSVLYTAINGIVSIPIFLLAFSLIVVQFWFLLIAFFAPFALIQSIFPGQFEVLRRYAIELLYPLVIKVLLSAITFFVFIAGFIVYSIDVESNIAVYFIAMVSELAVFAVIFIFRKPILRIMSAGSIGPFDYLRQDINGLRHSMNSVSQALTKTAGFVGGAASGNATTFVAKTAVDKMNSDNREAPVTHNSGSEATAKMDNRTVERTETMSEYSKPFGTIAEPEKTTPEPQAPNPNTEEDLSKPFGTIDYNLKVREAEEKNNEQRKENQ